MKAAIFHGPGKPLSIEEIQIDEPREHEVLVRTVATGVCHSDLHFVEGLWPHPTPAVLGHEAAGIVERVGSEVTYLKAGDHVISCPSVFCGRCKQCNSGHPYRCTNRPAVRRAKGDKPRLSKNGVMIRQFSDLSTYAEMMLLHENALVKIRDDMPLDRAALIGCGVTTGVGAAMVIAVDMFEHKLATAKRFGATHTVDASSTDPVEAIQKLTDGGVDYSFEAIGLKKAAEQCFDALAPGGTATVIGMIPVGQKVEIDGPKLLTERRIQGSLMGSNRFRIDMPRYIDFYLQGRLNL